jgi:hypothetical protein
LVRARNEIGRLRTRRGSNFDGIHSYSIRSQKKLRRLSMRLAIPDAEGGRP